MLGNTSVCRDRTDKVEYGVQTLRISPHFKRLAPVNRHRTRHPQLGTV